MNILVSWKESLKQFLFFGFIEDIKAGKPLKSMWRFLLYSIPIFIIGGLILKVMYGGKGMVAAIAAIAYFSLFRLIAIILSVKKIRLKPHYNRWYSILYVVYAILVMLGIRLLMNGIKNLIGESFYVSMFSLLPIAGDIDMLSEAFLISSLAVFSPITVFFVCFLFDTGISLRDVGKSMYNAVKMALYTYPVCLLLFYALISLYISFISGGIRNLVDYIDVRFLPKPLIGISAFIKALLNIYLPAFISVVYFSIFVGFYKNQRKKYPKLYS